MQLQPLLQTMIAKQASDLHLKPGRPPILRVDGQLGWQPDTPPLTVEEVQSLYRELSSTAERETFTQNRELDFAYSTASGARLRVNVALQRGALTLSLRLLHATIPTLAELHLPPVLGQLALLHQGLVLVTGPTGSGKSTTLAAMLEEINRHAARHIVTVEDPIEYIFKEKQCLFTQREVGRDTHSFAAALKYALRQDPDVIMVGEMRDLETITAVLTAAETGHLVLATLHTPSAPESIDRIVDVFPAHQQAQVRAQLAMTLAGVVTQRLVPRAAGTGRVAACEIMTGAPAIRNLIREGKTPQMRNVIQAGNEQGMQTLTQALQALYRAQLITAATITHYNDPARNLSSNPANYGQSSYQG
ncbi:MAG TPA: type IV pilus twitching motility protein PilT [Thermoflexia bacterium]|nr:type IV pilus twitching motility protein PilT [Thermoflexia bacterium]